MVEFPEGDVLGAELTEILVVVGEGVWTVLGSSRGNLKQGTRLDGSLLFQSWNLKPILRMEIVRRSWEEVG